MSDRPTFYVDRCLGKAVVRGLRDAGRTVSDRPTFYVDRCLGKAVVRGLRDAGVHVEAHDDHFAQDEPDDSWIPDVAARGWGILTKDKNIRRRAGERETLVAAQTRIITLTSGNMPGAMMVELFVRQLDAMEQLANNHPAAFVAILGPEGMRIVFPKPSEQPDAGTP